GSFAKINNGSYPHNILLHLLIEGGVLLVIPFILIIISTLKTFLKPWFNNQYFDELRLLIIFLFVISLPRLMLSTYLWKIQSFWLLIFIVILVNAQRLKFSDNS